MIRIPNKGGIFVKTNTKQTIFERQSIKTSLRNSYLYLMIILVVITLASFFVIHRAKIKISNFRDEALVAVNNTDSARRELVVAEKSIYKICLTKNETLNQTYYKEWQTSRENFTNHLNTLTALAAQGNSKDKISQITKTLSQIETLESTAIQLGLENKTEEAVATLESGYVDMVNEISKNLVEIASESTAYMNTSIQNLYNLINIFDIALVIALIFGVGLPYLSSKATIAGIVSPIKEIEAAMEEFQKGNLNFELDYHSDNELGFLAHAVRNSRIELQKYISNISQTLDKLANKDFTTKIDIDYIGDFSNIKVSLIHIISILNEITSSIKETSIGVMEGTKSVSSVAQLLADGTAEQSTTVEELTATISEVSEQSSANTQSAQTVSKKSTEATSIINKSNACMKELVCSMDDISRSSQEISNIVSVINNISAQTNMLALNASIEAARAGEHGKGFAVVAKEIGELAANTTNATKMTADLIQSSITAVNKGVIIAKETDEMLTQVVTVADTIRILADNVSDSSVKQTESLNAIDTAVEQISNVVQSNASISAEAAASATELEHFAERLTKLLNGFRLE